MPANQRGPAAPHLAARRALGPEAYRFVDWLAAAGQTWWQVLPLGPPDRHRSPYKSSSAFAAWPGLLAEPRAPPCRSKAESSTSASATRSGSATGSGSRRAGAVADQVRFEREWAALRRLRAERGVRIMGDVAIYVAPGSADHRAHPELFQDDLVAGAPPDAYATEGQLWGNPLYDWPALQRPALPLVGRAGAAHLRAVRPRADRPLPRLRGLLGGAGGPATRSAAAGHAGPAGPCLTPSPARSAPTCRSSPRTSASITPAVERLRDSLGLPGMLVLQFGLDPDDPHGPHRPANHVENRVVYTGTHDHDTARGWLESLPPDRRAFVDAELARLGFRERRPWWGLIRMALSSPAALAMVQAQDVLGLGSEARMNMPAGPAAAGAGGCSRVL